MLLYQVIGILILFTCSCHAKALKQALPKSSDEVKIQADVLSSVWEWFTDGYNIITGNPEGSFSTGGADPGRSNHQILQLTYDKGQEVFYRGYTASLPDQLLHTDNSDCVEITTNTVYSGAKSYRDEVVTAVEVEGERKLNQHT